LIKVTVKTLNCSFELGILEKSFMVSTKILFSTLIMFLVTAFYNAYTE